jgi:hypothetical protein
MAGVSRKPRRLFVSHISEEAEVARLLKQEMEEDFLGQVKLFTSSDIGSISAGEEWLTSVQQALSKAAAMLVLCSKSSISRPWVQFELGAAWMKRKRIIPICHSGMRVDELPMPLTGLQGVQLGVEAGVQRLYEGVADVLGWPKVPQPRNLARFLSSVAEFENRFQNPVQQFERYIDIVIPRPGIVDGDRIADTTRIESNDVSMELFGLIGAAGRTWLDICKAARKTADTRWLIQLQRCIQKASHNVVFRPVQAIYHTERGSYQPQLAKKEMLPDGSCRYHVHFVETTVAPLTEVQNDFGLLATLLRLGLRFRYEVIEHYQKAIKAVRIKPNHQRGPEMERVLLLLRGAIEIIENDALSRGAQNFDPDAVAALFEQEDEQHQIVAMQSTWNDTRALLFRNEPPLTAAEIEDGMTRLRDMNRRFMCLATKRYHEMVSTRWGAQPGEGVRTERSATVASHTQDVHRLLDEMIS